MKATLTEKEYREFTENVDKIKVKSNINIAYAVEYKGDKFIVKILDDVNLEHLDNILLDNEEWVWYAYISWVTEQALYLHVLVGLVLTTTLRVVGSQLSQF